MARVSNEILANILLENVEKLEKNTARICKTVEEKTDQLLNAKLQVDIGELQELQSSFKSLFSEIKQTNNHAVEQMKSERKESTVWYRWIAFCIGFALIGVLTFVFAYKYSIDTELAYKQNLEIENYIVPKTEYDVLKGFSSNFEKDFEKYKKWYKEQKEQKKV